MNILFITQKLIGGGAEKVTCVLASEFAKEGNNVFIATHRNDDRYDEIDSSVQVISMDLDKGTNVISRFINCLGAIRKLKQIKKEKEIECSISMLGSPNFENVLSRSGERVIISIRNLCSAYFKGINAYLNQFSGQHADKVVCLSENVRDDQIINFKTNSDKCITIYNPCDYISIENKSKQLVDDDVFEEIRKKSNFMVITAGRSTYQKGQWHMIRAFKKVVEHNEKAVLIILGCGDLDNTLENLIRDMRLEKNVFKLGFKKNIYFYMSKADLFAFTSLFEGFGNILLEAMACGLPIVSCDCNAGPRELLEPGSDLSTRLLDVEKGEYGVLTPVMDGKLYGAEEALTKEEIIFADAINFLMDDHSMLLHYKKKSIERIKDFSPDKILQQWKVHMK